MLCALTLISLFDADLEGVVIDLIDALNSTVHLEDQLTVTGIGSFRAFIVAKTFQLHL